jgi:hypothetical protein
MAMPQRREMHGLHAAADEEADDGDGHDDGQDARRGGGEVVGVEDPAALVDETVALTDLSQSSSPSPPAMEAYYDPCALSPLSFSLRLISLAMAAGL